MVKVGVLGFGMAGQAFHATVIEGVEGLQLACILERHGNLAREKYPDVRTARNLDELLEDTSITLCSIATPNDSHFALAKACLLAGRHVVIDKPMAPTWEECTELARIANEQKRILTVYHDRRFDADFRTIVQLVHEGKLGKAVEYECRYDRFRPQQKPGAWRERGGFPGAGVLFDLSPHLIDQALFLFGEPQAITAKAFCQRETSEIDDAFDICFDYDHLRANLRARILAYAPSAHFLIHGTLGSFMKYGMDPQEERLRSPNPPQGKDWGTTWGEESESLWGILSIVGQPSQKVKSDRGDYRDFWVNVRDAVEKGTQLEVTLEQSLRTMRALLLAQKSSREQRTVRWHESPE